ncbi:LolA family protein [Rickettsiales endosymbiont of Peranema trichophorum]|uniref:LolA family protein n=1 Tax=Rickettsiales endosymbiont of Peranema trichophorum TaxID=2486577 RepID=UPI001A9363DD|nr:outer membrane lipoprotein carrier protein LolA [Rickettsiales endosymbiont of Peranema trichophorum]
MPLNIRAAEDSEYEKIVRYWNGISSFQAQFEQYGSDGVVRNGNIYMVKSGAKVKLEYLSPNKMLVVSRNKKVMYYNEDLDEISYVSLESSPIDILAATIVGSSKEVQVDSYVKEEGYSKLRVKALKYVNTSNSQSHSSEATLVFKNTPLALVKIEVVDQDGNKVEVWFSDVSVNHSIDNAVFSFKNPKFFRDRRD